MRSNSGGAQAASPGGPSGAARDRRPGLLRGDPWLLVLACLAAAQYALLAPHLLHSDLALTYPFQGGDSHQWLLDGLKLAGYDVHYGFRPPALPLVLAALHHLSALAVLPLLLLGLHHGSALGAHLFLRRRYGPRVAFVSGLLLLTNATVLYLSLQVMGDLPAALLLGAACAVFLLAGERPSLYPLAGLLAGLSAVTQQAALLLPLPAGVTLLAARREHLRRPEPWIGGAVFALFPLAWFLSKKLAAGTFTDVATRHWGLLGFFPEQTLQYVVDAASLWGWPALALAAAGAVLELRAWARGRGDAAWRLLPFLAAATLFLFFALAYDWRAKRFLVYAFVPSLALVAAALGRLRRSRAFWPVAGLAVLIGAWPLPRPDLPTRVVLWPVPSLYAVVPGAGPGTSLEERFAGVRIEGAPLAEVARWTTWSRVVRTGRRAESEPGIDRSAFEGVDSAVFLGDPDGRFHPPARTRARLGNLVRRRVVYVQSDRFPLRWWGWRGLEPLGVVDRYRLFRVDLPDLGRTAVVAFGRRDRRGVVLERRVRRGRPLETRPTQGQLRRWLALGRKVDALRSPDTDLVIVLPEAQGRWMLLLPFMTHATTVQLPGPDERPPPAAPPTLELESGLALGSMAVWRIDRSRWPRILLGVPPDGAGDRAGPAGAAP